jgi:hypothetical protein
MRNVLLREVLDEISGSRLQWNARSLRKFRLIKAFRERMMPFNKAAALAAVLILTSSLARADNPALGTVDAPGAATGRYMGGRPGIEQSLHHYHEHYRHHRRALPSSPDE